MKKIILLINLFFIIFSGFAQNKKIIVLDPGHGGKDTGTAGTYFKEGKKYTAFEKDIVLNLSSEICNLLNKKSGHFKAVMTRNSDEYLNFSDRASSNTQEDEKQFLSIHCNSSMDKLQRGFSFIPLKKTKENFYLIKCISECMDLSIGKQMQNLGIKDFDTKNKADIIINVGFLSNKDDLQLLLNDDFIKKCAQGIADGIEKFNTI